VAFAEQSPFPTPESLYDDVYVLDDEPRGSYSVRTTSPEAAAQETATGEGPEAAERDGEIPQQITSALQAGEDA
jgi:hypothetical protein